MAGPSTLVPNLSEIMEEYTQSEGEVRQEPTRENLPSEPSEVQPVSKNQRKRGKEKQQEEEEDEFISKEAFSIWKKYYAGKGFCQRKRLQQTHLPFQGTNRTKRLEKLLQASKVRIRSSSLRILLQPGGGEG